LSLIWLYSLNAVWEAYLVCDFQEIYRYLIDAFVIRHCQKIAEKDFVTKSETLSRNTAKAMLGIELLKRTLLENENMIISFDYCLNRKWNLLLIVSGKAGRETF